jgi:hypothetical protein
VTVPSAAAASVNHAFTRCPPHSEVMVNKSLLMVSALRGIPPIFLTVRRLATPTLIDSRIAAYVDPPKPQRPQRVAGVTSAPAHPFARGLASFRFQHDLDT